MHIPGESGQGEGGGAQMVRLCDGRELRRADTSKVLCFADIPTVRGSPNHRSWSETLGALANRTLARSGLAPDWC